MVLGIGHQPVWPAYGENAVGLPLPEHKECPPVWNIPYIVPLKNQGHHEGRFQ